MSTYGVLTISGVQSPLEEGSEAVNLSIPFSAVSAVEPYTFASAATWTISVPTGCTGVIIVPPTGNTVGLNFKTVNGDTGTALNAAYPSEIALASSVTSIYLTSAGSISEPVVARFF